MRTVRKVSFRAQIGGRRRPLIKGDAGQCHWHLAWRPDDEIHALVDVLGRPLRLVLTPGNTSDVKGADLLIAETICMKRMIADRGYDANRIRTTLREQGTIPVIPGRRYKDHWRVEAMFCRLKDFSRIDTR